MKSVDYLSVQYHSNSLSFNSLFRIDSNCIWFAITNDLLMVKPALRFHPESWHPLENLGYEMLSGSYWCLSYIGLGWAISRWKSYCHFLRFYFRKCCSFHYLPIIANSWYLITDMSVSIYQIFFDCYFYLWAILFRVNSPHLIGSVKNF